MAPAAGRSVEDDDDDDYEDYYTDEDYAELEQAFEFTFWDAFDDEGKDWPCNIENLCVNIMITSKLSFFCFKITEETICLIWLLTT